MRIILIAAVLALVIIAGAFGQVTKKVTIDTEIPHTKEVFYVLKDNPTIKHGEYKRTFIGVLGFKENGQYDNGVKVGIWEFYGSKGQIEQKIDFTKNEVIFSKPFTSLSKSLILEGETLKENSSGESPILLGGQSKLSYYFVKYLRYPPDARRNGNQGSVLISATVTTEGKMIDEKVEEGVAFDLDAEALRIIQLLPDEWLPLRLNGQAVNTRVFLLVKFKLA